MKPDRNLAPKWTQPFAICALLLAPPLAAGDRDACLQPSSGLAKPPLERKTAMGVYSKSGHRSALALSLLHNLGYTNTINMAGGFEAWKKAEYPFVMPAQ